MTDPRIARMVETWKQYELRTVISKCKRTFCDLRRLQCIVDGRLTCVTCGAIEPAKSKKMHMGHFVKVGMRINTTIFTPHNVHPQCASCNRHEDGQLIRYTLWMQQEYWSTCIDELLEIAESNYKYKRPELAAMRVEWMDEIKRLEAKLYLA